MMPEIFLWMGLVACFLYLLSEFIDVIKRPKNDFSFGKTGGGMMSEKGYKRFYVSESENQLTIYDNEGLDDYYHLGNDERDVKGICKLLNEQQEMIEQLEKENNALLDLAENLGVKIVEAKR